MDWFRIMVWFRERFNKQAITAQLDMWTVFHMFGAIVISLILYLFFHSYLLFQNCLIIGLFLALGWELLDTLCYLGYLPFSFLDKRGASWIDMAVTILGYAAFINSLVFIIYLECVIISLILFRPTKWDAYWKGVV